MSQNTNEKPPSDGEKQISNASSGNYSQGLEFSEALRKTIYDGKYIDRYPEDNKWYKRACCGCSF